LNTAIFVLPRGGRGAVGVAGVELAPVVVVEAVCVGTVAGAITWTAWVRMFLGTEGVTEFGSMFERCCQPIQNPNSRHTMATAVVVT
jgi:hypothetical protein